MKLNLQGVRNTLRRTPFPTVVVVETIAFCNLKCVMCPQPNLKRQRGEMDFEVFKKIADEIAYENPSTDLWLAIMGEPLIMGDKLIEMIKYAKCKGIEKVHLNTNACLMTGDMAQKLINSGIDEIIIGMDAFTKETYERIRVEGNYNETVKNVEYFLIKKQEMDKDKPHLIVQFIVMYENEHEVEAFKNYWLEKGAIVKIRPRLGWGTGVNADNLNLPDTERDFPCPWLIRTVSIQWTGKFNQCDADFEGTYSPGDIRTKSIKEVWNGELAARREKHWNMNFSHDLCKQCKDWQAGRSLFYYPEDFRRGNYNA